MFIIIYEANLLLIFCNFQFVVTRVQWIFYSQNLKQTHACVRYRTVSMLWLHAFTLRWSCMYQAYNMYIKKIITFWHLTLSCACFACYNYVYTYIKSIVPDDLVASPVSEFPTGLSGGIVTKVIMPQERSFHTLRVMYLELLHASNLPIYRWCTLASLIFQAAVFLSFSQLFLCEGCFCPLSRIH